MLAAALATAGGIATVVRAPTPPPPQNGTGLPAYVRLHAEAIDVRLNWSAAASPGWVGPDATLINPSILWLPNRRFCEAGATCGGMAAGEAGSGGEKTHRPTLAPQSPSP